MVDVSLMREIGALQAGYNRLMQSKAVTKKAICNLVIPFRDKYGLSDLEALKITRNEMSIAEIAELLATKDPNPVAMYAEENTANAFSQWAHEKHDKYMAQYEANADSDFYARYFKGLAEGVHAVACMFDALTTRNVHLPPEIKPYLKAAGTESKRCPHCINADCELAPDLNPCNGTEAEQTECAYS